MDSLPLWCFREESLSNWLRLPNLFYWLNNLICLGVLVLFCDGLKIIKELRSTVALEKDSLVLQLSVDSGLSWVWTLFWLAEPCWQMQNWFLKSAQDTISKTYFPSGVFSSPLWIHLPPLSSLLPILENSVYIALRIPLFSVSALVLFPHFRVSNSFPLAKIFFSSAWILSFSKTWSCHTHIQL